MLLRFLFLPFYPLYPFRLVYVLCLANCSHRYQAGRLSQIRLLEIHIDDGWQSVTGFSNDLLFKYIKS